MSAALIAIACLACLVVGFLAGAVVLVLCIINRLDAVGRFDCGKVSLVGYVEMNDGRW